MEEPLLKFYLAFLYFLNILFSNNLKKGKVKENAMLSV
jgi:hypothetical protein